MVRTKNPSPKKGNRGMVYAIPVIAVVLTLTIFLLPYSHVLDKPLVESFDVTISIQVANKEGTQIRFLVPPTIGTPGGTWVVNTYTRYGVNGNYPLYTDSPNTAGQYVGVSYIHVRSNARWNYTLGDFFDVWGEPLSPSNTAGYTVGVVNGVNYVWEMCVGSTSQAPGPADYRSQLLYPGLFVTLEYYPPSGQNPGCLP